MNRSARKATATLFALTLLLPVAASAETSVAKKPWTYQETCVEQAENSWRCDFWSYIFANS